MAQVAIDDTTETWTYLTTDHLGTPLIATDDGGALVWQGGFEPFGTDYQAGSGVSVGNGASFAAGSGTLPEISHRTYTDPLPQHFLARLAEGPGPAAGARRRRPPRAA